MDGHRSGWAERRSGPWNTTTARPACDAMKTITLHGGPMDGMKVQVLEDATTVTVKNGADKVPLYKVKQKKGKFAGFQSDLAKLPPAAVHTHP